MYFRYLSFLFLLVILSCKYFKGNHCNNTFPVTGTYYNDYDKDAEHLLIIKEDGTFEQVFSKDNVTKKTKVLGLFMKSIVSLDSMN